MPPALKRFLLVVTCMAILIAAMASTSSAATVAPAVAGPVVAASVDDYGEWYAYDIYFSRDSCEFMGRKGLEHSFWYAYECREYPFMYILYVKWMYA
jgi:hypothetical protein